MDIDFADWLLEELKQRDWSQSTLAKKAGVNRQVVNTYINRQRKKPDTEILKAIARAFDYPEDIVFRAAGIMQPAQETDDLIGQILYELGGIPLDGKKLALKLVHELREHYEGDQ